MASKKLGALWLRQTGEGQKYFSGVIEDLGGDIPIVIFKNDRKEAENHPDYVILRSEPKEPSPRPTPGTPDESWRDGSAAGTETSPF